MLFKTLDNLRTKPKMVRDHYAFLVAVTFTLIIMSVWLLSLPARFDRISMGQAATTTSPFGGIIAQFKAQFSTPSSSTVATTTETETTSISSTEEALTLKLSSTTKAEAGEGGINVRFSTTTPSAPSNRPTILIGTSSNASSSPE